MNNPLRRALIPWIMTILAVQAAGLAPAQSWDESKYIFGRKETFGIGPRAMGMGGAFSAVADDASAVYWNPAGLVQVPNYVLSVSSAPVYFREKTQGSRPAFGKPWLASFQLIAPIAKDNTVGLSYFRPFHPQRNFYLGQNLPLFPSYLQFEQSYLMNPSFQQNELLFTYAARFSRARAFSVGVNVKRVSNDRYYIRYFGSDPAIDAALTNSVRVRGYGVDLGFMYRIPITKYSQELRVSLVLKDLVTRVTLLDGLEMTLPNGDQWPYGPGVESDVPPEITMGLAYKNNHFFRLRNITAFDFDQISDPRFDSNENKFMRLGTEFWFFRDVLGIRGGYATPMSRPGHLSMGGSIRALQGDFQIDMAFINPVASDSALEQGTAIAISNARGINFEKFHIGLSYRFGAEEELPAPKVDASVRPAQFAPNRGEKAEFFLDTTEDVDVERWSVLIYDSQNRLVRAMRGRGTPPVRLTWGGETDAYEPAPSGIYTWAFQVRDQLGHVGSTPVKTVEILAPPAPEVAKDARRLYTIRQQQEALLTQERQQLTSLAQAALRKLMENPEATPTTANAVTESERSMVDAEGNTQVPEAGNVAVLGFANLSPDQVLNAHFETNPAGERVVVVNYRSNLTVVPYLYREAAAVIKTASRSVGLTPAQVVTRAYYGKNELVVTTPTSAANGYAQGRLNDNQLFQASDVRINGEKVVPNVQ
jgi:hypothetical protein